MEHDTLQLHARLLRHYALRLFLLKAYFANHIFAYRTALQHLVERERESINRHHSSTKNMLFSVFGGYIKVITTLLFQSSLQQDLFGRLEYLPPEVLFKNGRE